MAVFRGVDPLHEETPGQRVVVAEIASCEEREGQKEREGQGEERVVPGAERLRAWRPEGGDEGARSMWCAPLQFFTNPLCGDDGAGCVHHVRAACARLPVSCPRSHCSLSYVVALVHILEIRECD